MCTKSRKVITPESPDNETGIARGMDRERFGDVKALCKKGGRYYYDWGVPKQTFAEVKDMNTMKYSKLNPISIHRDLQFFYTGLECSTPLNSTLLGYSKLALIRDMARVFNYIPYSEVYRMVCTMFWMMTEGLKIHGRLLISNFCKIDVTPYRHSKEMNNHGIPMDKNRICTQKGRLKLSKNVKRLLNPMSPYYLSVDEKHGKFLQHRSMTGVLNAHKIHYRLGKILLSEKPFKPVSMEYLGHSENFRDVLNTPEEREMIFDSPSLSDNEWGYIKEMYYNYTPDLWKTVPEITDEFPGPYRDPKATY